MHLRILLLSSLFAVGESISNEKYADNLYKPNLTLQSTASGFKPEDPPSRYTVWNLGNDGDALIKFHPPHACTHMQMCGVDNDNQTCAEATNSRTIMVFPGLEKAMLFKGKDPSPSSWHTLVDTLIMSRKKDNANNREFFSIGHAENAPYIPMAAGLLRIETPSFYCNVHVVKSYSIPEHYTFVKESDDKFHYAFEREKFDATPGQDDAGPMFMPKGGVDVEEGKSGDKRVPNYVAHWKIKEAESTEQFCPTVDEWIDFAQWGKYDREHGNLLTSTTFLKQTVLRYRVEKTDECDQPSNKVKSIRTFMVEFDNPKQLDSEEYELCRGFSLCFQNQGDFSGDTVCNDKTTTFEIYPDNMMIIGPDSPDARMLMETRDRMQYMRFILEEGTEGDIKVTVHYDLLNMDHPGAVEVFHIAKGKNINYNFYVDVIRDGQCPMRLLSDPTITGETQCLAVTQCTAYDVVH